MEEQSSQEKTLEKKEAPKKVNPNLGRPILVTGCQGSGTSAVAGALFYLHVFMGRVFQRRDGYNPKGYFECQDFVSLDQGRFKRQITEKTWKERVNKVKEATKGLWGWKSPSALYFLEDYKEILNPVIIYVDREKDKIIASCMAKGLSQGEAEENYEEKKTLMDKVKPDYVVKYEELMLKPEEEIQKLTTFLGLGYTSNEFDRAVKHITDPKPPIPAWPPGVENTPETYENYTEQ